MDDVLQLTLNRTEAQAVIEALDCRRDEQADRAGQAEATTRRDIRRRLARLLIGENRPGNDGE